MIAAVPRVHQTENHMIDAEFYWTKVGAITWGDLAGLCRHSFITLEKR